MSIPGTGQPRRGASTVAETEIGENGKLKRSRGWFEASVGCVGFVITWRNRPGHQFIGSLSGGQGFGRRRAAAEETESYWRAWLVSSVVANSPAMSKYRKPSYCNVVKCFSMWRTAVIGQRRRDLSQSIDEQGGTVSLAAIGPKMIQAPRSLPAHGYPQAMAHESWRSVNNRGEGSPAARGNETAIWFSHCTIGGFCRQPDSPHSRQIFSKFCKTTPSSFCNKVVELLTISTFAITVPAKFPLNLAQIWSQVRPIPLVA
jgi:hypothetical protein